MITVKITDHSIWMSGHACRKSLDGIDRACAAVSALTCNLINSLRDLTEDHILTLESRLLNGSSFRKKGSSW